MFTNFKNKLAHTKQTQNAITHLCLCLVLLLTPSLARSTLVTSEAQKICDSIDIVGGTPQERLSVCEAISWLLTTMQPYGIQYDWNKPLKKIEFHERLVLGKILNPKISESFSDDEIARIFGEPTAAYIKERKSAYLLNYKAFKKKEDKSFKIDYKTWVGALLVHEVMHYFFDVNSNNVALGIFDEALSHYLEIEYIGAQKAITDRGHNADDKFQALLSESLHKYEPILFSLTSWFYIQKDPSYYIPRILNGDINIDYLEEVHKTYQ